VKRGKTTQLLVLDAALKASLLYYLSNTIGGVGAVSTCFLQFLPAFSCCCVLLDSKNDYCSKSFMVKYL